MSEKLIQTGPGKLSEWATVKEYLIVRREGSRKGSWKVRYYNLEAVLGVGYRVQSPRGTQFRQQSRSAFRTSTWRTRGCGAMQGCKGAGAWLR